MIGAMVSHPDYVQVGSTVVVSAADGEVQTYVIVQPAYAAPREGKV